MSRAAIAGGALAVALALLGAPDMARAEGCGGPGEEEAGGQPKKVKWHWEVIDGRRVQVFDNEAIRLCGKVPRPNVALLLKMKTINYEWENLKQDFLPLILASVKKAPF